MTVSALLLAAEQSELRSRKGEINFFFPDRATALSALWWHWQYFLKNDFQLLKFTHSVLKHGYFQKCRATSSQK